MFLKIKENLDLKFILSLLVFVITTFVFFFSKVQWGLMDDSEYVLAIQEKIHQHGFWHGLVARVSSHASLDFSYAGVIRPSFWLYTATFYQLPVGVAYFIRLIMYVSVVYLSLGLIEKSYLSQKESVGKAIIFISFFMILSLKSAFDGVAFVSLQEFSGLFFIICAYSLLSFGRSNFRNLFFVFLLLIIGIGFKPPFIWVLFLFSIHLFLIEKKAVSGAIVFLLATGYFFLVAKVAQQGVYSQKIYQFEFFRFVLTAKSLLKHLSPTFLLLLPLVVGGGYYRIYKRINSNSISGCFEISKSLSVGIQLFLAAGMYLLTLMPRGISKGYGYYFGAPLLMLFLGVIIIFLSLCKLDLVKIDRKLKIIYFLWAFALGTAVYAYNLKSFSDRMVGVDTFLVWLKKNDSKDLVIATNSAEVNRRLTEIYFLEYKKNILGKIVSIVHEETNAQNAKYYLVFKDQVPPNEEYTNELIWSKGSASLFQIN